MREHKPQEISAEDLVPGDLLLLKPGSYVAADSRLLEAHRLTVDESALTGESLPVHKVTASLTNADLPLADRVNMVYMGTLVTGGQGLAVVVATGARTEIGTIQVLAGEAESPQTPMERQLDQLGNQLVLWSGAVCGVVFGIGLLRGYGLLEMLKTTISLAVAAVPEGLPTVATMTLALGVVNMRKHHVLIRRLTAVETLGCVQTICFDKTGTLTQNRMSVVAAHTGGRRLRLVDGQFYLGQDRLEPLTCEELLRLAQVGVLCSETEIECQEGHYVLHGSSTENALISMALSAGIDVVALRHERPVLTMRLRSEDHNCMSTVHGRNGGASADPSEPPLVAVKGSPSEVLAMCAWQLHGGRRMKLTKRDRRVIEAENERMAGEGLRVLGGAYGDGAGHDAEAETSNGLTWLGLIGMADRTRAGVKEVIADLHRAGIDTVMITGDQSATASAIGKELALSRNGHLETLDSTHLADLASDAFSTRSDQVHVFARVSPAHKLQIVQALQRSGKVVAMTGDGINDGLALALEEPEPDILQRPPRNPDDPIIKTEDLRSIAYESATLSAGALGAYGYGLLRYGVGPQASTLAFTGLITGQLLHAVSSRSETHSVFDPTPLPPNPYLSAALLGSFGLQALTLFVPGLRSLLGITPVSLLDGLVIGASALVPFVINESSKALRAPRNDQDSQPQ